MSTHVFDGLDPADPAAEELIMAIHSGAGDRVRDCLAARPDLANVYIGRSDEARTALLLATDWPGHFPNIASTIALLVGAGADVDAPFIGRHSERPLHWAASSGDVAALDALLAAGADVDAPGGVLTGGSALDDAVIFDMLDAARHLVRAGATIRLFHAAALGLIAEVAGLLGGASQAELDASLWHACHHGETDAARLLVTAGADQTSEGFNEMTPLDAARDAGADELAAWLSAGLDHGSDELTI